MSNNTTDCVLYALFCLSRENCVIDASELGKAVGSSAVVAAEALVELEHAGLVDASRVRLTMRGLAKAAALDAAGGGGQWVSLRHAKPRTPTRQTRQQPLAAGSIHPSLSDEPTTSVYPITSLQ